MRVLAVRQDNNGDVLLVGPALRAIAADADVTLLCGPSGAGAARLLPQVADVIVARAEWIEGRPRPVDPTRTYDFITAIAAQAFDRAIVFTSFHQSALPVALLLRLAGVPWIGAISVDYPGSLLDMRLQVDDDRHEVERALALAAACGYRLPLGDDGALRCGPLPPSSELAAGGPYVVVQPGATVPARAWDPARWRGLVARMDALEMRVVIVGSPAEVDLARSVSGESGAIDTTGHTTFAEFAAIVRDARALVVGNTSGIHVASAVGTPVVTIFPPTIPARRFAPWRVAHAILGDQTIACAGCRARACPIPGQPCTAAVEDDEILAALATLCAGSKAGICA